MLTLLAAVTAVRAFGIARGVLRYAERLAAHDAAFRVLGELRGTRRTRGLPAWRPRASPSSGRATSWPASWVTSTGLPTCGSGCCCRTRRPPSWRSATVVLIAWLLAGGGPRRWPAAAARDGARRARSRRRAVARRAEGAPRARPGRSGRCRARPAPRRARAPRGRRRAAGRRRRRAGGRAARRGRAAVGARGRASAAWSPASPRALDRGRPWCSASPPSASGTPRRRCARRRRAHADRHPRGGRPARAVRPPAPRARGLGATRAGRSSTAPTRSATRRPGRPRVPDGPLGLRARGLSLRYPGAARTALAALDLDVPAGARVVVTGPSGAGKSTLAAACLRFLDPAAGLARARRAPTSR